MKTVAISLDIYWFPEMYMKPQMAYDSKVSMETVLKPKVMQVKG